MLVLNIKEGEEIKIGNDVQITVYLKTRNSFKVCLNAPKDVRIVRKEVELKNLSVIKGMDKEC